MSHLTVWWHSDKCGDRMQPMCHTSLVYMWSSAVTDICEDSSLWPELLREEDLLVTAGLASFGGTAILLCP